MPRDERVVPQPALLRRLGVGDAVFLGLGSMLGAGVFAAFGPAAAATGAGLLLALLVAGLVAGANAWSSARLAARYPESGGTYVYGRRRLGPAWGFVAGWGFVVGKTASCAAMALTIGVYAWPAHSRLVGAGAVVTLTVVNCLGVGKTARATRVLVVLTLVALAVVVTAAMSGPRAGLARPGDWFPHGPFGVLQAAGLLFFAFAGYARIATLGEEVRDPARTIPRAIPLALGIALLVYALVGAAALAAVGPDALAASPAPLATAAGDRGALAAVVRVGGAVAAIGVLLSLLAGVGRTLLAMARDREVPHLLAAVDPRHRVPRRAQVVVGSVVTVLVLLVDLRDAIGFSGVAVLCYYAIAHACALTLPRGGWQSVVAVAGLVGCLVLAASLPATDVAAGVMVLLTGPAARAALSRRRGAPA